MYSMYKIEWESQIVKATLHYITYLCQHTLLVQNVKNSCFVISLDTLYHTKSTCYLGTQLYFPLKIVHFFIAKEKIQLRLHYLNSGTLYTQKCLFKNKWKTFVKSFYFIVFWLENLGTVRFFAAPTWPKHNWL